MKLIFALGNPGKTYQQTYHNCGFLAIDLIADSLNLNWKMSASLKAEVAETIIDGGEQIIFAKPTTFMNRTGVSLQEFLKKYPKLDKEKDVIIVYDDLDLVPGKIRLKEVGSAGAHNGVKSICEAVGSKNFKRVRIGTGERPDDVTIINFVLKQIPKSSKTREGITLASRVITDYINGADWNKLMCENN